jgi:hypothetical protein
LPDFVKMDASGWLVSKSRCGAGLKNK